MQLAIAEAKRAIGAIAYSISFGGDFPHQFDNPLFMKIFQWGGLLSRVGIAAGLCGSLRPNTLRWRGLASAVGGD